MMEVGEENGAQSQHFMKAENYKQEKGLNADFQTIQTSALLSLDPRALESVQPMGEVMKADVSKPNQNHVYNVINGANLIMDDSVLQLTPITSQPALLKIFCPPVQSGVKTDLGSYSDTFECQWKNCHKRFPSMEDMVNHVTDSHVKVERDVEYRCHWEGCSRKGRGFNARYKVLIHLRTHTNEKPHKCDQCGKSFSRLENLKIHKRTHTGEKPYSCPFEGCNKAYTNSSDRFKHIRTHQTDKPYMCKAPGCGKRYTDPSSLRKHIKTHGHFSNCPNNNKNAIMATTFQPAPGTIQIRKLPTVVTDQLPNVMPCESNPPPTANAILTLAPNGILGLTSARCGTNQSQQIIPLSNTFVTLPSLTSNPLLSSTIITSGVGSTNTNTVQSDCSPSTSSDSSDQLSKDIGSAACILDDDVKTQDRPLDLTTSPVQPDAHREVTDPTAVCQYTTKWDLINTDLHTVQHAIPEEEHAI